MLQSSEFQRSEPGAPGADATMGRVVSVAGAKAIVMLDAFSGDQRKLAHRPEMGTLLAIETPRAVVLAIVSALTIPVPAQREGESEFWIAELALVGELSLDAASDRVHFRRGTTSYPALADRVRAASQSELQIAFNHAGPMGVRIGTLRQDSSIAATISVDDLLGKHFAVLGTTGTGKSCTTALILRAILERNPAAHIVMLDPHNEYASAFGAQAEVIAPRDLQLPLWLLNFDEAVELLVGDRSRKAEIEILSELIPIARARFANGRSQDGSRLRRTTFDQAKCSVDAPFPYRVSDLLGLIEDRMGRLENRRDLPPYRQLKNRIELICSDARYSFLFGSIAVSDDMTGILGRLFRVPVDGKPLTIIELTGLPSEAVNVVVAVLCRLTFEFVLWSNGQVPVTLVCEEAHRYVPASAELGFEPCRRAIAKIAKEGRKYGASLCIVTQRPAEVDPTILSQCNTVFALRMSNDRDQAIVGSAIADTGLGLLEFLPALGQREAVAFGDGVALPVRILFDELPAHALPRSSTACFSERWQNTSVDLNFLETVVERWRTSGLVGDPASDTAKELTKEMHRPPEIEDAAAILRTQAALMHASAGRVGAGGASAVPSLETNLTSRYRLSQRERG